MKYNAFDMLKYNNCLLVLFLLLPSVILAQNKYEREHRIKKSQFPEEAHRFISENFENARRFRFYREIDSARISFGAKFKKERLYYHAGFNEQGKLEEIKILVGEVDIPNDALLSIKEFMSANFRKYRTRKIWQQYAISPNEEQKTTLKNAFQNLLIPGLRYELFIAGKKNKSYVDYELLFDADGNFISIRASLPANYDRVLY